MILSLRLKDYSFRQMSRGHAVHCNCHCRSGHLWQAITCQAGMTTVLVITLILSLLHYYYHSVQCVHGLHPTVPPVIH